MFNFFKKEEIDFNERRENILSHFKFFNLTSQEYSVIQKTILSLHDEESSSMSTTKAIEYILDIFKKYPTYFEDVYINAYIDANKTYIAIMRNRR